MAATNFSTANRTYRELLGNGLTFSIPRFQRDYAWDEEHWEDLWADCGICAATLRKPRRSAFWNKLGAEQPEYIPDFVAETDSTIFMVETKARADLDSREVRAKAVAAAQWCKHASDYTASRGSTCWYPTTR